MTRFLEQPSIIKTKVGSSSAQDNNSAADRSDSSKNLKNKRMSNTYNKSLKRQKVAENSGPNILKCKNCKKGQEHDPKTHTMDFHLVSKIGWYCIDCKFWVNCK